MAVYYRYRSGVDTFSLPVATPSISVGDLKRLILATSRHGHSHREGIAISDEQTGHQYTDDIVELVPRNSTVLVRRVPAEEDDDEVSKAISTGAELEWEVMTSITTEKLRRSSVDSNCDADNCGPRKYNSTEITIVGGVMFRPNRAVARPAQPEIPKIEENLANEIKKLISSLGLPIRQCGPASDYHGAG